MATDTRNGKEQTSVLNKVILQCKLIHTYLCLYSYTCMYVGTYVVGFVGKYVYTLISDSISSMKVALFFYSTCSCECNHHGVAPYIGIEQV